MKQILILLVVIVCSCSGKDNKVKDDNFSNQTLTIFHAGSLSKPLKEIADSFQKLHPRIKINREAAGSVECVRKITELRKNCDILFSADFYLIEKLMYNDYADWSLPFATNEMVIAFLPNSETAKNINSENWVEILNSKKVRFARSDPNADPCGYRTLLTWKLSEKYYNNAELYDKLFKKDNIYIRPKEVDLLALLESKTVDYIFIYKSVAIQHKLGYINLNDSVNLGNPKFEELYKSVDVVVRGKKPTEKITINGSSILYGYTIPKNAQNIKLAEAFLVFLMNEGASILKINGQKPVRDIEKYLNTKVPTSLSTLKKPNEN